MHCYYKCGTRKRSGKEVCSLKPVRKEPLEQFVVQTALEKVLNDRVIDLLADKLLEYQSKENTRLPVLQAELKEVKRRIDNLVAAIEQGILTPATKARMEELEQQREALETGILQERIEKPPITREQILFWFDQFRHGDPADIEARMKELAAKRKEKQPLEYPSAGSTFKRPAGHFAGGLIEQCGLKGTTVGGAQVSEKHAGFVINTGQATCQDILTLIRLVRDRVFQQTGVRLEPEVRLLGCTLEEP